jgi:hypothetical protein
MSIKLGQLHVVDLALHYFCCTHGEAPIHISAELRRGCAHVSLLSFANAGGVVVRAREAAAALSGNERLDFHLVQTSLTRAAQMKRGAAFGRVFVSNWRCARLMQVLNYTLPV